jgi:hypothetical protein
MDIERWLLRKNINSEKLPRLNTYHISNYKKFYSKDDIDKQIYLKYYKPLIESEEFCLKHDIYIDPTYDIQLDNGIEYYRDNYDNIKKIMYIEPLSNQYYVNDLWKEIISYCCQNNFEYKTDTVSNIKLFDPLMKQEFYKFCQNFSKT